MHFDLVIIFFIYGLAFFSMGIAITLEMGRKPIFVERGEFVPLAFFGLLHGGHEWLEIMLLQGAWLDLPIPYPITVIRLILLAVSFLCLLAFGIAGLHAQGRINWLFAGLVVVWLGMYVFISLQQSRLAPEQATANCDALARYMLAVPSSLLAGWSLASRTQSAQAQGQFGLRRYFRWAAFGFGLYGLTQVFVSSSSLWPARYLNAALFTQATGLPIQIVRAVLAVILTWNILRAIQTIEQGRERQLATAQAERLAALEQLHHEISQREEQRRQLLRHIVIAQEDERARIAHELHDETAQILTAFSLNLATLHRQVSSRNRARELIDGLQVLCQQMSQSLYHIVRDLRPAQLDDLGLASALHYLVEEDGQHLGLQVNLQISGTRQRLDPLVETVIFRVAQEALSNVGRHAHTRTAIVELCFEDGQVTLRVCDEGSGFDPLVNLAPPRGWGLAGMRERVEAIDGQFNLQSAPGTGTTVEVIVPLVSQEMAEPDPGLPRIENRRG